jgi:hypothetical protein
MSALAREEPYQGGAVKKLFGVLGVLLLAALAYFCLWPVPIEPVSWNAPKAPGYEEPHAVNDKLAKLNMIDLGAEAGPEHIALSKKCLRKRAAGCWVLTLTPKAI